MRPYRDPAEIEQHVEGEAPGSGPLWEKANGRQCSKGHHKGQKHQIDLVVQSQVPVVVSSCTDWTQDGECDQAKCNCCNDTRWSREHLAVGIPMVEAESVAPGEELCDAVG